jgi:hypothetical protein
MLNGCSAEALRSLVPEQNPRTTLLGKSTKFWQECFARGLASGQKNAVLRRGTLASLSTVVYDRWYLPMLEWGFCGGTAFFGAGAEPPNTPLDKSMEFRQGCLRGAS